MLCTGLPFAALPICATCICTVPVQAGRSALFARDGDTVALRNAADGRPCDVLLLSGAPLREPVALGGPIVMNTRDELRQAYRELQDGTFLDV